jgi:CBS domain-containing protein
MRFANVFLQLQISDSAEDLITAWKAAVDDRLVCARPLTGGRSLTMKVQEVMTEGVKTCGSEANLATAAAIMWNADCGVLPVVDGGKVVGVITDRDMAIALGTRPTTAAEIQVGDVMSAGVQVCKPDDDIDTALKTMQREKIHRLPVVKDGGEVVGILSMRDVALRAENVTGHKANALTYEDVVNTLKAICEPRHAVETKKQKAAS